MCFSVPTVVVIIILQDEMPNNKSVYHRLHRIRLRAGEVRLDLPEKILVNEGVSSEPPYH